MKHRILEKIAWPPSGTYIVAVSGGLDSIVLLDLLSARPGLDLVVAHFDHGIRAGSAADARAVRDLAANYGYPFVLGKGRLGGRASEEQARAARYGFLQRLRAKREAKGIITGHHLDDSIETSIFNALRGAGRDGLSGIHESPAILRPLLKVKRSELLLYAKDRHLDWHEDETNQDLRFSRNKIRRQFIPFIEKHDPDFCDRYAALLDRLAKSNDALDADIARMIDAVARSSRGSVEFPRHFLIELPGPLAAEVILRICRLLVPFAQLNRPQLQTVIRFVKAAHPRKRLSITAELSVETGYGTVRFTSV